MQAGALRSAWVLRVLGGSALLKHSKSAVVFAVEATRQSGVSSIVFVMTVLDPI